MATSEKGSSGIPDKSHPVFNLNREVGRQIMSSNFDMKDETFNSDFTDFDEKNANFLMSDLVSAGNWTISNCNLIKEQNEFPDIVKEISLVCNTALGVKTSMDKLEHHGFLENTHNKYKPSAHCIVQSVKIDLTIDKCGVKLKKLLSMITLTKESKISIKVDHACLRTFDTLITWLQENGGYVRVFQMQMFCTISSFRFFLPVILTRMPNLIVLNIQPDFGSISNVSKSLPSATQDFKSKLCPKLEHIGVPFDFMMNTTFLYWLACLNLKCLKTVGVGTLEIQIPKETKSFYDRNFNLFFETLDFHNSMTVKNLNV